MRKKSAILILGTVLVIAAGAAAYFTAGKKTGQPAMPAPTVNPTDKAEPPSSSAGQTGNITYLVSKEDKTKFCNGADMDSEGYAKTIIMQVTSNIPRAGLSESQLAKETAVLATDGMCQEVLKQTDFKVTDGAVEISPIEGWAGISITMCACQPEVEVNLLRIPGIKKVVWLSN